MQWLLVMRSGYVGGWEATRRRIALRTGFELPTTAAAADASATAAAVADTDTFAPGR